MRVEHRVIRTTAACAQHSHAKRTYTVMEEVEASRSIIVAGVRVFNVWRKRIVRRAQHYLETSC